MNTITSASTKVVAIYLSRWECNLAAVWGQMSTGGGHSKLEETLSVIGVPVMTKKSFIDTESDIGETWRCALKQSMMEAGQREREIAVQKVIFMREFLPLPLSSMEDGVNERINTLIMPSLEWQ